MNREQMIEKAARASHQWGLDFGGEYAEWDALRELTRREYREEAAAVVEALLPRVTTVEELEALPVESILLTEGGVVFKKCLPEPFTYWRVMGVAEGLTTNEVRRALPLTVVWQP